MVAERIPADVVMTPTIVAALSSHHLGFPGTVDLGQEGFAAHLTAYLATLRELDIDRVALLSSHGGNFAFLGEFAAHYRRRHPTATVAAYTDFRRYVEVMAAGARKVGLEPPETDIHAGALETSQALYLFPDLVQEFDGVRGYVASEEGWVERLFTAGVKDLSPTGVLGDPRGATAHAGKAIMQSLADHLAAWIDKEVLHSDRKA
jgi:creatinine amidohydrolase